ncbi:unnamed protein product [Cylicocyclus nassatus]|uniref:Uncharacterized protein n=1 Tax=Cylicocyclus nassatus TaxID=53992 RepID=A0AA36HEF9_CYLNA|nr:unnamed protein product [Cylicocyclus nassatus]
MTDPSFHIFIFSRSLKVWSILIIVTPVQCDYLTEQITGCSSKCSVTTDKDLTCFNTTLEYFTATWMGVMRNYVASQLNLAERSPNRVPPSKEQMVSTTLAVMSQVQPLNIEDEEGLLSVEQARPIVEALVDNVLSNTPGMYNTSCPEGCELSESPWIWLFLVSALANVLLVIMTIAFMMHSYFKAKRMLRETGVPSISKEIKQH